RINRLTDEVFYGEARVIAGGEVCTVDARPSDALNLALLLGRPIRVERAVLDVAVGSRGLPGTESTVPEHAGEIASDALSRMPRPLPPRAWCSTPGRGGSWWRGVPPGGAGGRIGGGCGRGCGGGPAPAAACGPSCGLVGVRRCRRR